MPNALAQNVIRILSETTGEFVASAMVERNCRLIGTTPQALSSGHLAPLADTLEESISFFADKEIAMDVARRVRALGDLQWPPKHAA